MDISTASLLAIEPQLRLAAFVGVLLAMAAWEVAAPLRPLRQPRASRWPGNLGVVAVSTLLVRLLVPVVPVGAAMAVAARGGGLLNWTTLPGWLDFVIAFVALDLVIYAQHRAMHAVPLLWRLHRMHHADLELDATTGLRFHPLEIIVSLIIKLAAVVALGAPVAAVMIFEIVLNATSMFNHANVRIPVPIDRWLRLLVVTPLMHRVHHSIERRETDSNFGFNLPWWDRLLGTYRAAPAAGYDAMVIGLAAFRDPGASRLDQLLAQPFMPEK